jgi:DNA-binding HxlR family transcriptional regulator
MPHSAGRRLDEESRGDAAVLQLFDVLGRRWALRVIWELRTDGLTYRELAARIPDMSTSVLTQRLRDLRAARLMEHERGSGYRLTGEGRDLAVRFEDLRNWAGQVGFAADRVAR